MEREEMAKMAQTFKESTFKDLPVVCMAKFIATMRKMAMTQDKVNRNIIKTIIGIVKSPLETPY